MVDHEALTISRLGAQGDGVAETTMGSVFVRFALPGERVRVTVDGQRGSLLEVEQPSANRVDAVCRHFGTCGGCALQHMAPDAYRDWKRETVVAAFAARGIQAAVDPVVMPGGHRRRAVFGAQRRGGRVVLGYHRVASHDLIDVVECPVLDSRIVAILPALRDLLVALLSKAGEARVTVTAAANGLDVSIDAINTVLSADVRSHVASTAGDLHLARVSIGGETVFAAGSPILIVSGVEVSPSPGGFLQAVGEAEAALVAIAVRAVGRARNVADLFCGHGAFTFALAKRATVLAVDNDKGALSALSHAARRAQHLKPITVMQRDLFREPLSPTELAQCDAAIFDPPRAGAEAQTRMLARSRLKTIVAISCNPATLARDARLLIDAGFKLGAVTPVEQFQYSPHIEAVAVFNR